jgi:hypothetical protein
MTQQQIAILVASKVNKETADRYEIISVVRGILSETAPVLSDDRDTIDSILDKLFEMGYNS